MATQRVINSLELKGGLNGLKMILGAALIVLAGQVEMLNDLLAALPQYSDSINEIIHYIEVTIKIVTLILQVLGNGFLTFGFADKVRKFIAAPKKDE